ncbi:MAG TPA: hypothetical protein VNE63_10145 [Candidatus Acidoferrales bacterium]|nr:hypothetical protein [Candidatus Acidoferrales bacterium]
MPVRIQVEQIKEGDFQVRVMEGASQSSHRVTVKAADYRRLSGGKAEPQELVRRSFEFLLDHERKESILPSFDLMEIQRYFPDFAGEIQRRLLAEKD